MPRPLREDFEGAWHHVMNRGAGHTAILATADAKSLFLSCVAESFPRYGVEVHAYCLMDTHYHLLLRSTESCLSDAMRFCSGRFTRLKNKADGRDGPLFRRRFTSVGIDSDAHLIQAFRYIHLNPAEAGLVGNPSDWSWSSLPVYLDRAPCPDWMRTALVLEMFGPSDPKSALSRHLDAGIDDRMREFYARL